MNIAEQKYTEVWERFRTYLIKSDYTSSLSNFCRLTGTNYHGMGVWLSRHNLSVSTLKEEIRPECMVHNSVLTGFAPMVPRDIPNEGFNVRGISVTFHSGTIPTVREGTPEGIIRLIREYERKEGDICSL
mgnify:FL=1